tara:strand:+ start:851 stop:1618 length:768 start_codon:yes stop_codon:yes gene_type:complete
MSDNMHGLDEEEVEQDEMKEKLDLITVTSAKNLETMKTDIDSNSAVTTTHEANFAMTNTSTLRTYAETTRATANANTTAIAGITSGLFDNMTYFIMNSPSYYDMVGSSFGAVTGSELTSFELTTDPKRFVIDTTGIAQDTFSPNQMTFSESGTKVTFGWTEINVLVFYKMEHYDNSAGNRTITFGMYDDVNNVSKFSVRHDVYMDSSTFRFKQISGFAGTIAIQSSANYYFYAQSSGGGKLQNIQFFLVNATKAF